MTPSNANTSGLGTAGHVVWWKAGGVNYYPDGEAFTVSESCRIEPLVTAASAQARIAELEAKAYAEQQAAFEENRLRLAAEARADRLAKALEAVEGYEWPVIVGHDVQTSVGQATGAVYENRFPVAKETALSAFNQVKSIARAALQQEG